MSLETWLLVMISGFWVIVALIVLFILLCGIWLISDWLTYCSLEMEERAKQKCK